MNKGLPIEEDNERSCRTPGNARCNQNTWHKYGGYKDGCCSEKEKCAIDEGNCNMDSECFGSLICKRNSCPVSPIDGSSRFDKRASCCQQPSGPYKLGTIVCYFI